MVITNKKGQIFILAAVIISVIVLSMGVTTNYANVKPEPRGFYEHSVEIKRETGAVIDYEIYTNFQEKNLEEFVQLLVADIKDRDSESSFVFIYGDNSSVTIENYGKDVAQVRQGIGDEETFTIAPGALNIESKISVQGSTLQIGNEYEALGGTGSKITITNNNEGLGNDAKVHVTIVGNEFTFPITEHKQVIFLIQKEEGDEIYVAAE